MMDLKSVLLAVINLPFLTNRFYYQSYYFHNKISINQSVLIKVSSDIIIRLIYNVHFSLYLYLLKILMTCVEGVWFYYASQLSTTYLKTNAKAISAIVQKMPTYVVKAEIVFAKVI